MNKGKKWIGVAVFAVTIQVVFWITYTQTENIVGSIGITAGVSITGYTNSNTDDFYLQQFSATTGIAAYGLYIAEFSADGGFLASGSYFT